MSLTPLTFLLILIFAVGCATDEARKSSLDDLRQGMAYSEAREIILDAGWQTKDMRWQDRRDMSLYGRQYMYDDKHWFELQDCSGTGMAHCYFEFRNVEGTVLEVVTAGEGDDPGLDSWQYK